MERIKVHAGWLWEDKKIRFNAICLLFWLVTFPFVYAALYTGENEQPWILLTMAIYFPIFAAWLLWTKYKVRLYLKIGFNIIHDGKMYNWLVILDWSYITPGRKPYGVTPFDNIQNNSEEEL